MRTTILVCLLIWQLPAPSPTPLKASKKDQQKRSGEQKEAQKNDQATNPQPSTPNQAVSNISPQQTQQQPNTSSQDTPSNRWIAIFTFVLTVVGVLQWWTTRKQARLMTAQTELMNNQTEAMNRQTQHMESGLTLTRDANIISGISADAARKSADAAVDALHAQRAHIVFKGPTIIDRGSANNDLIATYINMAINWENGGHTTALKGICLVRHVRFDRMMDRGFAFPTDHSSPCAILTLRAGGTFITPITIPSQILVDIADGTGAQHFLYGWCAYRDIFSDTPHRLTEFCCRASGISRRSMELDIRHRDSKFELHFEQWHQHNGTDEDCPDYPARITQYERLLQLSERI